MPDQLETHAPAIDRAMLTPLVRKMLNSQTTEVTDWKCESIHRGVGYGTAATSSVYRVSGRGRESASELEWSLILKVLQPPDDRGLPSDWDYWRREGHAYESGLLEDLPGGLIPPRCMGVVDQPNGECWIWLEEVADDIGEKWPLEHYGVVARQLGRFNGAYLMERQIPSLPWLRPRGWQRQVIDHRESLMVQIQHSQRHPLVRRAFPTEKVSEMVQTLADRQRRLDAVDRLPRTLCHFDAFRRNMFAQRSPGGREGTVIVDWAQVGVGWIGRDIRSLVGTTLTWGEVDEEDGVELDRIVFAGYLDGLREVGWEGDPQEVRLGQIAPGVPFGASSIIFGILLEESRHAELEQTTEMPIADFADRWGRPSKRSQLDLLWDRERADLLD